MEKVKKLAVLSVKSSARVVYFNKLEDRGTFLKFFLDDQLVAGFSIEAIDEFYITDPDPAAKGGEPK